MRSQHSTHNRFIKWENLSEAAKQQLLSELGEPPEELVRRLIPHWLIKLNPGLYDGSLEVMEAWMEEGAQLWVVGPLKRSEDPRFVAVFEGPSVEVMKPLPPRPAAKVEWRIIFIQVIAAAIALSCMVAWKFLNHEN